MAAQPSSLNAHLLFQHFDTLAETPDAVVKLRAFVLDLAVRGSLVQSAEKPNTDQAWLKFLAEPDTPSQGPAGMPPPPFETPAHWRWVCLSEISDCRAATKVASSEIGENDWVLDLEDIDGRTGNVVATAKFAERRSLSTKAAFQKGDVLYGKLRPYLNKVVVAERPGFCTTEIIPLRPKEFLTPKYLRFFLRSPHFVQYAQSMSYGMKMPRLGTDDLEEAQVAVPPPEEQRRIVAKVEELLALCDELEMCQVATRENRTRLVHSALGHLTAAKDEQDFRKQCSFLLHNSSLILDSVPSLRQAILSLAVRGRLVPQDAGAKSAQALVDWIAVRMAQFIKSGAAKKGREFAKLASEDQPFELPSSWVWSRLGFLTDARFSISYGVLVPGPEVDEGIPFVRLQDLSATAPAEKPNKSISASVEAAYSRTRLHGGEILLGVVGSIGKLGVAPPSWAGANIARAVSRIVPDENMDRAYLLLVLQSSFFQQHIKDTTRTLAQPTLNITHLEMAPVPVPPLAEQQRIVAKVDELMRSCDALEARLTAAQTTATHLLDATLDRALKGEL
jgi:type I restriction enzyme S subunit